MQFSSGLSVLLVQSSEERFVKRPVNGRMRRSTGRFGRGTSCPSGRGRDRRPVLRLGSSGRKLRFFWKSFRRPHTNEWIEPSSRRLMLGMATLSRQSVWPAISIGVQSAAQPWVSAVAAIARIENAIEKPILTLHLRTNFIANGAQLRGGGYVKIRKHARRESNTRYAKQNARGFPRASSRSIGRDQNPDLISSNSSIILSRSSVVGGDWTNSGVVTGSM